MTISPNEIGPRRPRDPRGWLVFDSLPDELQHAEDATQYNDKVLSRQGMWHFSSGMFMRRATPTERALLQHLGFTLPDELHTQVWFVTDNVRNRRWPALEDQNPNPQPAQED